MNEDGGSRDERDASQPEARKFHQSCTRPDRCDARHEPEINFLTHEVMRKFLNSSNQEFMSGFINTETKLQILHVFNSRFYFLNSRFSYFPRNSTEGYSYEGL